jgi:translation initiation factor IF-2
MFSFGTFRFYYKKSMDGAVGRKTAKATLLKGRNEQSRILVLPPFVAVSELRVMFGVSYEAAFQVLNVKSVQKKFYWNDHEGRAFETANKRNVLVPFEIAARAATQFRLKAVMLDVEPEWSADYGNEEARTSLPTVVTLGHINHGKTTLLDRICNQQVAKSEPGGITQQLRACSISAMTFIDTPGHSSFEVSRGLSTSVADLALVVVSAEKGAEVQTEEVLFHADKFQVPVIFAINKMDLPTADVEFTRNQLIYQCGKLKNEGIIETDFCLEAKNAVAVSGLTGQNVPNLLEFLSSKYKKYRKFIKPKLPQCPSLTVGKVSEYFTLKRRTDFHVGVEEKPKCIGIVLDVSHSGEGKKLLVNMKKGSMKVGDYFVAGTVYGKVKTLEESGTVVTITGIRTGDCTNDDLLMGFGGCRERAHRLSAYRERISMLNDLQVDGPPLKFQFALDASMDEAVKRSENEQLYREKQEDNLKRVVEAEEEEGRENNEGTEFGAVPDFRSMGSIYVESIKEKAERIAREKNIPGESSGGRKSRRKRDSSAYHVEDDHDDDDDHDVLGRVRQSNERLIQRWGEKDEQRMRMREVTNQRFNADKKDVRDLHESVFDLKSSVLPDEIPVSLPVIPIILKCSSAGTFTALMDEIESIAAEYNCKLPIVHGGLGMVNSLDLDHAIAEKQYGYCPVYGVSVGCSSTAQVKAQDERIAIKSYQVFTDVIQDIRMRCKSVTGKVEKIKYNRALRKQAPPTESGM